LIVVTGLGDDADRAKAKASGFDVYVLKPYGLDELAALVAPVGAPRPCSRKREPGTT
jgi:DNA-binding response OmpR family regulator